MKLVIEVSDDALPMALDLREWYADRKLLCYGNVVAVYAGEDPTNIGFAYRILNLHLEI